MLKRIERGLEQQARLQNTKGALNYRGKLNNKATRQQGAVKCSSLEPSVQIQEKTLTISSLLVLIYMTHYRIKHFEWPVLPHRRNRCPIFFDIQKNNLQELRQKHVYVDFSQHAI